MRFKTGIAGVLLALGALMSLPAYAAAAAAATVTATVTRDGHPLAGMKIGLQLADLGKAAALPTDGQGNSTITIDMGTAGRVQVGVDIEDCPNGETKVVLVDPNGKQETDCRRNRIAVIWLKGSDHLAIDVARRTVTVNSGAAPATAAGLVPSVRAWKIWAGVGYAYYNAIDCGSQQSSGGCDTKKGFGIYALDLGRKVGPIDLNVGFLKSFGTVGANATSGSQSTAVLQFKVRQEWRAYVDYPFNVGPNFTMYPMIGIARTQGEFPGGGQTCFTSGGESSCFPSGGQALVWTTRGLVGVGAEVGINDQSAIFMRVWRTDFADFGALDSPRYQAEAGFNWRF